VKIDLNARKIFSVPLNPKLNEQQFLEFYQFLERNKDWISDVYFTSRIAPFKQDAMGDVFVIEQEQIGIENALEIQRRLGIPVSATFNNIQIPPTQTNLDTFIINFKRLYDAGIRTATIPHTHWLATGQIQTAFPELFIKNTILRDVRTASEIVALAQVGYDYINLDRDLMRDKDTLLRLKQAKQWVKENMGKDIYFSLLANEGCLGACPMMVEHFEYNNNRTEKQPQYFNDPISRVSCPKWDVEDASVPLKTANFSPWKADWDEYLNDLGIDVFKMHGREDIGRLYETMELVERYIAGHEFVPSGFEQYIQETELTGKPIEIWRDKIRNCKFDCWECQYCDKIYEKKSNLYYSDLARHVVDSIALSGIPKRLNNIPGLTSPRVQTLLNLLASKVGSYMEIGSYLGATGAAVLHNNPLQAHFIDKWEQQIQPKRDDLTLPANSQEEFEKNITPFAGSSQINVINSDMFEVDTTPYNQSIQMFFYDGPHDPKTTYNAITYYYSALASEAIVIMDDANWDGVVDSTLKAFADLGAQVTYQKLMLNSEENSREWWNGLFILVIKK
jgi:predicted O-methyltransferase YrrM